MKFDKLIIKGSKGFGDGLDVAKVLSVLLEQLAAAPKNTALKFADKLVLGFLRHKDRIGGMVNVVVQTARNAF